MNSSSCLSCLWGHFSALAAVDEDPRFFVKKIQLPARLASTQVWRGDAPIIFLSLRGFQIGQSLCDSCHSSWFCGVLMMFLLELGTGN